jgi:RND family efflux transporter MFP subunit
MNMIRRMKMIPKKWAYTAVAVVAVAAVAGAGYSGWLSPNSKQAGPQQQQQRGGARQFPVETQIVKMSEVAGGQVFTGSITPVYTTNISAKINGRVTEIMVKVGDRVKVGQPLAKLDTSALEQTLASAQADLAASQAQYQKSVNDQANSVAASEKSLAFQQANLEKAILDQQNAIAALKQQVAVSQANYNKALNDQQNAIATAKQNVAISQQALSSALATYNTNLTNALNALNAQQDSAQTSQVSSSNNLATLQLNVQQAIINYNNAVNTGKQSDIDLALQKLQSAQLALDQAQQSTPSTVTSAISSLVSAQNALASAQNSQAVQAAQEQLNKDLIALANAQNSLSIILEQNRQSLQKDQLALANAQASLETNLNVNKAQVAQSEQALQNAKSLDSVNVSRAQLEQAEVKVKNIMEQLQDGTLLSPVDGVVTAINTPVGQNAGTSGSVLTVASLDPVQATVNISEANIGKIKVGMEMKVKVPTINKEFDGVVSAIRPTLDSVTKSYGVDIQVADPNHELLPGMFAMSSLKSEGRKAIMIPAEAVVSQPSGDAVFVVQNGQARKVTVKVGALTSSQFEIVSGLKEGDEIVVKGQELLSDRAPVQVVQPGQQAQPGQQGQGGGQQGQQGQGGRPQGQQSPGGRQPGGQGQESSGQQGDKRNSTGGQRGENGQRPGGSGAAGNQTQRAGGGQ